MNKNKKTGMIASVIFTALYLLPCFAIAQDPGGDPDVPIDGGLSLLLAAGAAYGVKKYRDHKKQNTEDAGQDLK